MSVVLVVVVGWVMVEVMVVVFVVGLVVVEA